MPPERAAATAQSSRRASETTSGWWISEWPVGVASKRRRLSANGSVRGGPWGAAVSAPLPFEIARMDAVLVLHTDLFNRCLYAPRGARQG